MEYSPELINKIAKLINESEDFITDEQIKIRLSLSNKLDTSKLNLTDSDSVTNFLNDYKNNQTLKFVFGPAPKFGDPYSSDFDPEYLMGIYGDPKYKKAYFITAIKYFDLVEGLIEIYLEKNGNGIKLSTLLDDIKDTMVKYLGIEELKENYDVELINETLLEGVLQISDKFCVSQKSKFNSFLESEISLIGNNSTSETDLKLYISVLDILNKKMNKEINLSRLALELSMDEKSYGIPKPIRPNELQQILEKLPRISLDTQKVRLIKIEETLVKSDYMSISVLQEFESKPTGPGFFIFKYDGDRFPINAAIEYVNLRPVIYIMTISNVDTEIWSKITSDQFEMSKNLSVFLKENELINWLTQNTKVSFVQEAPDYINVSFDKLMQEYSPVLNLDKNPGNLFRGIIEEKIREYESGKES